MDGEPSFFGGPHPGLETTSLSSGFFGYRVPITGRAHRLTAQAKVGVTVYGYDEYGYLGGQGLVNLR